MQFDTLQPDTLMFLFGLIALLILLVISLLQSQKQKKEVLEELRNSRMELSSLLQSSISSMSSILSDGQRQSTEIQTTRLGEINKQLFDFSVQNEKKLEQIRTTVENKLKQIQEDNTVQLEKMRATVDEKLQKTLEERISKSFQLVSERLEQVYKGLGEMQTLALGVGELKNVLSNVKTRGILGEIQLGAILEQLLAPEQYVKNIVVKKNSREQVEFAIKLPGDGEDCVYLPIDAKFPADAYANLMNAYEAGNKAAVDASMKELEKRIKQFAKDIHDKYIEPPFTTDFAILFLPIEGLYAEVVRGGLVETLQRDYKITIAGPTTMAALLNSLQMGFQTLAIQKRSGEVWSVLGGVKTEFDKFGLVLDATQKKLEQATLELDKLVGVRTRQIQSKLRSVTALPQEAASLDEEVPDTEKAPL